MASFLQHFKHGMHHLDQLAAALWALDWICALAKFLLTQVFLKYFRDPIRVENYHRVHTGYQTFS